jgi:hypothetical protein
MLQVIDRQYKMITVALMVLAAIAWVIRIVEN